MKPAEKAEYDFLIHGLFAYARLLLPGMIISGEISAVPGQLLLRLRHVVAKPQAFAEIYELPTAERESSSLPLLISVPLTETWTSSTKKTRISLLTLKEVERLYADQLSMCQSIGIRGVEPPPPETAPPTREEVEESLTSILQRRSIEELCLAEDKKVVEALGIKKRKTKKSRRSKRVSAK